MQSSDLSTSPQMACSLDQARPFWHPLFAGVSLGLVLLATFVLTGHGLGATGFTTRLGAWVGDVVAPAATQANNYLGPMVEQGGVLQSWITWQVMGVIAGALVAAAAGRRLKLQIEGEQARGRSSRLVMALLGGILAGFGARVAAGCTSGVGLSGTAVLGVGGFVFLGAFFVAGLVVARLTGGGVK